MNKIVKTNNFLRCNNCDCCLLNVVKTTLTKSENAFMSGESMKLEKGYLETDVWYDIKTTYKCLDCESENIFEICNHKGGVKQSWSLFSS